MKINPWDRVPAPTGYAIVQGVGLVQLRLDIWPTDEDPTFALVILSSNGAPVTSWYAKYRPRNASDPILWQYFNRYRNRREIDEGPRRTIGDPS